MSESCSESAVADTDKAFPVGGGELGALIRNFDWSATSLGPISGWPASLRTATNILLRSPLPLVMLWGPDGIMIYNDAYAVFAGQRHPRLLGSKVLEGWPEVADFNARVLEVGFAGGTLSFKDQELTLYRNDVPEQVWMDLNYGPVLCEDNKPGGILAIVAETTERVRAERRQVFLFELGDRLLDLADADEITAAAAKMLGRYLPADRVGWAKIDEGKACFTVDRDWTGPGMPSGAGHYKLDTFGAPLMAEMRAGHTVWLNDSHSDSLIVDPEIAAGFSNVGIGGAICVPLIRAGAWMAALYVHSRKPRQWREDEWKLVQEVAHRVWAAVQRAHAEANVRKSEARFRTMVNATSDFLYSMTPDWAEMRRLDGQGFVEDARQPSEAWGEALFPEDQPKFIVGIREAIREKRGFQLEHRVRLRNGTSGWMFSRVIPVFNDNGEVIEWFGAVSNVSSRKQAEEHLRLVVNELNHRVKNNLAMVQAIAAQSFGRSDDIAQAKANFTARIIALAQANDLLTGERGVGVALKEILEQALRPHIQSEPERCFIDGPDLQLSPKTALSLSMAIHELATNAIKYGAWSNQAGKIAVTWAISPGEEGERLRLEWRETGGPRVSAPHKRGFGSRLIQRGLAAELGGTVTMSFDPDGLVCVVDAPFAAQRQ